MSYLAASKATLSGESTCRVSINDLGQDHLAAFKTALSNVLSTPLAESTLAQIMDGLPTLDIWRFYSNYRNDYISNHRGLCPGSLTVAIAFRARFNPNSLQSDASVNI